MATDTRKQAWAQGGTVLAGTLMLIIGAFQIFLGLMGIIRNNFVVVTPNYYYSIDTTAWGWVHLGIGVVVALAGLFLFTGSTIAKVVGIGVVAVAALGNFFMVPYYPVWSILLIALDIFAIWAIATARTDYGAMAAADERAMAGYGTGRAGEPMPEYAPGGRHWAPENVKEGAQGSLSRCRAKPPSRPRSGRPRLAGPCRPAATRRRARRDSQSTGPPPLRGAASLSTPRPGPEQAGPVCAARCRPRSARTRPAQPRSR